MRKLVKILRGVQETYQGALTATWNKKEKSLLCLAKCQAQSKEIKEIAAKQLKSKEENLLGKSNKEIGHAYFPEHPFELDMMFFRIAYAMMKPEMEKAETLVKEKVDKFIVKKMHRVLSNTFVNNPNFKGCEPYYKRNWGDMCRAQHTWLECLDSEFDGYISYFEA